MIFHASSTLGNTREIRDKFHFYAIHFLWETKSAMVLVYVIARVGVKFGKNFTSVRWSGNKIARGEAECYLPLNLTRVKFVPEISRLTVLLKINTIASLLFILKCTGTLFARSLITYISYFYCLNLIASHSLAKYSKLSIDLPLTKLLDDHKSLTKTIR